MARYINKIRENLPLFGCERSSLTDYLENLDSVQDMEVTSRSMSAWRFSSRGRPASLTHGRSQKIFLQLAFKPLK
jgi:hypothetical protein